MDESHSHCRGAVIIEFLIAMIVFCFLCVIGTEISFLLQVRQVMAVITREASVSAFKDCSRVADNTKRQICLSEIVATVGSAAQSALSCIKMTAASSATNAGSMKPYCPELILSVYDDQAGIPAVTLVGTTVATGPTIGSAQPGPSTSGGFASRFSVADSRFATGQPMQIMLNRNRRIVICEVFWRYHFWLPSLRYLIPVNFGNFYDADIV